MPVILIIALSIIGTFLFEFGFLTLCVILGERRRKRDEQKRFKELQARFKRYADETEKRDAARTEYDWYEEVYRLKIDNLYLGAEHLHNMMKRHQYSKCLYLVGDALEALRVARAEMQSYTQALKEAKEAEK